MNDDLAQADVEREFPGWRLSRNSVSGLCYGARKDGPLVHVHGEDWTDLRDQIRRAEADLINEEFGRSHQPDGRRPRAAGR